MREPLFKINLRLRKMPLGDQCAYLIACIAAERKGSTRRRELHAQLVSTRADQIRSELPKRRRK
jgi:hypothetical protein